MWRSLLWKDGRQVLPLFIGGVVICLLVIPSYYLLPRDIGSRSAMEWLTRAVPNVVLIFVLPLFAAVLGASAFAPEVASGSMAFLLARPVRKAAIWGAKVTVGLAALAAMPVAALAVTQVLVFSIGAESVPSPWIFTASEIHPFVLVAILNYYAAGLLGSVVFENPMSAIVTGYFAGLALVLKIANAQCFNEPVLEPGLLFIGMAVPGLGLLSLSLWKFAREELSSRDKKLGVLLLCSFGIALGASVATLVRWCA